MTTGRKELLLETEILAELSDHPDARVVASAHEGHESRAMIEHPRPWWFAWLGPRRTVISVSYSGHVERHRA